jgi:adenine-specific DNA-methyltransferase
MPTPRTRLLHRIVADFAPRHVRRPRVFHPGRKVDRSALAELGIPPWSPVTSPDIVIHDLERDWLFLVDAVTTRRPMDESRRDALASHFSPSRKGLIFFSAFADGAAYSHCAETIAWETNVWIADAPDHMIHYNGERFLGPYNK